MANWKMIASFASGAIIGGGITFIFTKLHLERKKVAEINEYRMTIVAAAKKVQEKKDEIKEQEDILEETESDNKVADQSEKESSTLETPDTGKDMFVKRELDQYVNYASQYESESDTMAQKEMSQPKKEIENHIVGPYAIDPDDYGRIAGYEQIHLTYYSDNILADDDDCVIEHHKLGMTVGEDFKEYFGEYSDDAAWFRNDDVCCDYEIERSMEPYYGG